MIETKVKAGTAAGGLAGLVTWALVTYVPAFHSGLPGPVADALPFVLAWIGHTYASYRAPHTHRPDLAPASGPAAPPSAGTITIPATGPITSGGAAVTFKPATGTSPGPPAGA